MNVLCSELTEAFCSPELDMYLKNAAFRSCCECHSWVLKSQCAVSVPPWFQLSNQTYWCPHPIWHKNSRGASNCQLAAYQKTHYNYRKYLVIFLLIQFFNGQCMFHLWSCLLGVSLSPCTCGGVSMYVIRYKRYQQLFPMHLSPFGWTVLGTLMETEFKSAPGNCQGGLRWH